MRVRAPSPPVKLTRDTASPGKEAMNDAGEC